MKKNKFTLGWFFISLLMAFAVTACDDDDNDVVNVTFPEKQTIGGAVNETKSLTFDAVADWTLTSSTTWCYFITEETPAAKAAETVKEYNLSGKAGRQTVKFGISNEGQDYDNNTIATITIRMNGQEAVLAEITRNPAGRTFKLYKKGEGDAWVEVPADQPIEAGYSKYVTYKAEANFPFAATNRPEWLDIEGGAIVGTVNKAVEFGIKVVEGRPELSKYEQSGSINFQAEDGKGQFTYALNYKGMDPEAMDYEGPGQWNWTVSLDGQTFIQTSQGISGGEETSSYNKFVEFTITARNDEFEPVFVTEYQDWTGNTAYEYVDNDDWAWMNVQVRDPKTGKIRVTVKKLDTSMGEEERIGYIFVFPKALYDKMQENPEEYGVIVKGEYDQETMTTPISLREEYFQNYLLMNFIQKEQKKPGEVEEAAFNVYYKESEEEGAEKIDIEQTLVTGENVESNWGTKKVYSIQPKTIKKFIVEPILEGEWEVQAWKGQGVSTTDITEEICTKAEGAKEVTISLETINLEETGDIELLIKQNWMNQMVLIIKK